MGSGKVTQKERLEQVEASLARLIQSHRTLVRCIHSLAAVPTGNPGPLDWQVLREMTKVLSAHSTTLSPAYYCSNPSCPVGCPDSHALPPSELYNPEYTPPVPMDVTMRNSDPGAHLISNAGIAKHLAEMAPSSNDESSTNHKEASELALLHQASSNLARCYLGLARCCAELKESAAAPNDDTALLDYLADTHVFDGYGGFDIDELTLANMPKNPTLRELPTEEAEQVWKLEWRKQFRYAIRETMKADTKGTTE